MTENQIKIRELSSIYDTLVKIYSHFPRYIDDERRDFIMESLLDSLRFIDDFIFELEGEEDV